MNDEDFARTLLTRAASGADEPRLGLDVDQLVHDGRRASRTRVAGLATGGTVLAGAVALSAWGLPGSGSSRRAPPSVRGRDRRPPSPTRWSSRRRTSRAMRRTR